MELLDLSADILAGFSIAAGVYWATAGIQVMFNAFRQVSEPELDNG